MGYFNEIDEQIKDGTIINRIAHLEYESTVLRSLVDAILANTKLDEYKKRYDKEDRLIITDSGTTIILNIVKAFYDDEYGNRLGILLDKYYDQEARKKDLKESGDNE